MSMTDKPSREDVLRVAGECGIAYYLTPANTREMRCMDSDIERFAAAMYAAGAEDRRERAAKALLAHANWSTAPRKTAWGDGMMVADVMLTKDETLTMYVHKSALPITPTSTEGEQ